MQVQQQVQFDPTTERITMTFLMRHPQIMKGAQFQSSEFRQMLRDAYGCVQNHKEADRKFNEYYAGLEKRVPAIQQPKFQLTGDNIKRAVGKTIQTGMNDLLDLCE